MMKKVLIIDDEPFARRVFHQVVEKLGIEAEVIEAADGDEAWVKVREAIPDLMIVDINLPFINGVEFIAKLRAEPDLQAIPCVVVTANTSSEIQEKVKDLGAVEVISKIDVSSRVEEDNPLVVAIRKYL